MKKVDQYITNAYEIPKPFYFFNMLIRNAGYHLERHSHDRFHVNMITGGMVDVVTANEVMTVRAGEAFIMPPHVEHELWSQHGYSQVGMDVCDVRDEYNLAKKLHDICAGKAVRVKVSNSKITAYMTTDSLLDLSPLSRLRCINHMSELLITIIESAYEKHGRKNFRTQFIQAATQYDVRRAELNELCEKMHFSRTHLERLVKKEFGCSVIEYTDKIRFMKVCELLVTTDKTLAEIADECGFYDNSHLTVFFKKHSGKTPGKYRLEEN